MKYALFTLLFLVSSKFTFCQNVFQVYDSYTLEVVDSLQIYINNKKATISKLSGGVFTVENGKKGNQITIKNPDYDDAYYYLANNQKSTEVIMLSPSRLKLKEYKSKLPYYDEYSLMDYKRDFPDNIMDKIDSSAMFPGGKEKLYDYLRANIIYPQAAVEFGIEGKVIVQFIVDSDGTIETIRIIRSVNQFMDAEAYRVIQTMPAWNPATYKGIPTKCIFNLPVSFQLN